MAKGVKPLRAPKHDWVKIRSDYVQTATSLRQLAVKHSISERALAEHCKSEGWVELRQQFRSKVTAVADERALGKNVAALEKGREMAGANARMIMALIAKKLGLSSDKAADKDTFAKLAEAMDPLSLLRLAKSNDAAFLSLCKSLGIVPVDASSTGDGQVDLPADPQVALAAGVTEPVDGSDDADED